MTDISKTIVTSHTMSMVGNKVPDSLKQQKSTDSVSHYLPQEDSPPVSAHCILDTTFPLASLLIPLATSVAVALLQTQCHCTLPAQFILERNRVVQ